MRMVEENTMLSSMALGGICNIRIGNLRLLAYMFLFLAIQLDLQIHELSSSSSLKFTN
jgi:hypothetical protein